MCKILIVEDDADIRDGLFELLTVLGHEAVATADGAQALEWLAHHPSSLPCVTLLDLRMPVMDGWEFLRHLRQSDHGAALPVIVLSASLGMDNDRPLVRAEGHWRKPVPLERIERISDFCLLHRQSATVMRRSRPDLSVAARRIRQA